MFLIPLHHVGGHQMLANQMIGSLENDFVCKCRFDYAKEKVLDQHVMLVKICMRRRRKY
jgi:hypothetical protein